ncbi:uncharacterized protein OCT59_023677 [Rhizophagus irregularis]|uniref:uncharacterized protein n=1 Tax=Rhizophagus irregularis TaxID=588596 RepID=UPI0033189F65|nr:hypothetical protein OCT59_023677 [Rhizophagus irregularis]
MTDCTKIRSNLVYSQELGYITGSTLSSNIPVGKIPPIQIAILRIKGNESAEQIFSILQTVLDYAHKSNINIFSMRADGARSEFNAQTQITTYFTDDPFYNVHLKVPIINGKPLVRIQDQKHAKKSA